MEKHRNENCRDKYHRKEKLTQKVIHGWRNSPQKYHRNFVICTMHWIFIRSQWNRL